MSVIFTVFQAAYISTVLIAAAAGISEGVNAASVITAAATADDNEQNDDPKTAVIATASTSESHTIHLLISGVRLRFSVSLKPILYTMLLFKMCSCTSEKNSCLLFNKKTFIIEVYHQVMQKSETGA